MNDMQQFYRIALNHTMDLLIIVNRNRQIIYATPNILEVTGYSFEEAKGMENFEAVHPDDREYMLSRHKNLLSSKQSNTTEYRFIKKDGEVRHFECKTTPLPETDNYLQVVAIRDITERKVLETVLERHKNRHEVLQNSLKNFSNDLSSIMKLANLEDRILKELESFLPGSNPNIIKVSKDSMKSELGWKNVELSVVYSVSTSDNVYIKMGERKNQIYILTLQKSSIREKMDSIWLETLSHFSMKVFENLNLIENLMDKLEKTTKSNETPQWMLRMMFNLQEQQRLTLSSDLHDTVLQHQIDLYRRLESILNQCEIKDEAKTKLLKIEEGLLDIIHEIRMACNRHRPPLLRELGLGKSLENLFEHTQVASTYKIIFNTEDISMISLSEEQIIGIYRVVQEFLYYAEEYPGVNIIKFDLYLKKDKLQLVYSDDGLGRDLMGESPQSKILRLTSISQRVHSLCGKLNISSNNGQGLMAFLEFPIKIEGS